MHLKIMKALTLALAVTGSLMFSQASGQSLCCAPKETASSSAVKPDPKGAQTVKLKITGMTCAGCASQVHKVLSETPGVLDNSVEYPGDIAVIKYNPEKTKPALIIETIEKNTSYTAEVFKGVARKNG